ncbi:hypothetical protein COX25_01695 [bacterium (Candidatus Howlettbacteria) CG23_combo_of_CG06-09_8_20_14_all_37_9]|nr:MAG: hypothetical protein COX25_01695 [bacterium (Candidatus Howlettbacteria) CG23_combo_of_CG06-09_8_20_14_all_37_9]
MAADKKIKEIDVFCSVSSREIEEVISLLIPSLGTQIDVEKINLTLINYNGKGRIYNGKSKVGIVSIREISKNKQLGFGEAHNFAFQTISPDNCFLITNPGYLYRTCVSEMLNALAKDNSVGIVEARQLPFEHPKEYDEKSGEAPWASGACMMINSNFFKKSNGFDENFWMYCEDVDLSWRAWLSGYRVIYEPRAVFYHFTGAYFGYSQTRYYLEHFWSARNFIYLSYKYFGEKGEERAINLFKKTDFSNYFKKEVLNAWKNLRKRVNKFENKVPISKLSSKIKIVGFNKYHENKEEL